MQITPRTPPEHPPNSPRTPVYSKCIFLEIHCTTPELPPNSPIFFSEILWRFLKLSKVSLESVRGFYWLRKLSKVSLESVSRVRGFYWVLKLFKAPLESLLEASIESWSYPKFGQSLLAFGVILSSVRVLQRLVLASKVIQSFVRVP